MSTMQNKEIVRSYIEEVFNKGILSAADQYLSPGFVDHNPFSPQQMSGPAGQRQVATLFREAFTGFHAALEDVIAEGDIVANRATIAGTQSGSIMGIPPTGRQVSWQAMTFFRLANGKIVERWSNHDLFGLLQELGVLPSRLEVPGVR
jgi:steroid delta-isomerase-like uncharacterized protein